MKELVIKRQANVTSADALDEISAAYPHAEVLSFRRVRDNATESDLFVTRIRVAADFAEDAVAGEEGDMTDSNQDGVYVEDKDHEDKEQAMMEQMLKLLRDIKDAVDPEEETESEPESVETEAELEMKHKAKPLPEPSEPPFGSAGFGQMTQVASLVVQRPANISKTAARVELIREFSDQYRIGSIEEHDGKFLVNLYKRSDVENMPDPKQRGFLDIIDKSEPAEPVADESAADRTEYDDEAEVSTGLSFADFYGPYKAYKARQKGEASDASLRGYVHPSRVKGIMQEHQDTYVKQQREKGEKVPSRKDLAKERRRVRPQRLPLV